MTGAILPRDLAIILRPLVDIFDHHRHGSAGRDQDFLVIRIADDPGQDPDLVRLAPLGDEPRLSRTSSVEIVLDIRKLEADTGRAAINDAAQRRPVALAPGGDPK